MIFKHKYIAKTDNFDFFKTLLALLLAECYLCPMKNYRFQLLLLGSLLLGSVLGYFMGPGAEVLKPLGDIFLNLLFCVVVPLVFFSISSAVAGTEDGARLGKIAGVMLAVFVFTGILSSVLMLIGVSVFDTGNSFSMTVPDGANAESKPLMELLAGTVTVPDFVQLLSRKSMLALILFAALLGLAAQRSGEEGQSFRMFLVSGNAVFLKLISYVMYYAPIGLAAYFAWLVGVMGPQLLGSLAKAVGVYHLVGFFYFFVFFTLYALWVGGLGFTKRFWKEIIPTSLIAFGTGSSMASIPSNLEAADKLNIPKDISRLVIPVGATIHMDGSCLSAILKIAMLHQFYGMEFFSLSTMAIAVCVALLCGVVMSGIPGGGYIAEALVVTLYGFPPEALPIISLLGTLVDPLATLVNAVGDNIASAMVARGLGGREAFDV